MNCETENKNQKDYEFIAKQEASKLQLINLLEVENGLPVLIGRNANGGLDSLCLQKIINSNASYPKRKNIDVYLTDVDSFIEYVLEQKEDTTKIFASVLSDPYTFKAAIDFIEGANGKSSWNEHNAVLTLSHTSEFLAWLKFNGNNFSQEEFAEFLQDYRCFISKPDGADLLEMISDLQIKRNVNFRQQSTKENGDNVFTYEETNETSTPTKGVIELPASFEITIAPFIGSDVTPIEANFRYRMRDGRLVFSYKLQRLDDIINAVIDAVCMKLKKEIKIPVFKGHYNFND